MRDARFHQMHVLKRNIKISLDKQRNVFQSPFSNTYYNYILHRILKRKQQDEEKKIQKPVPALFFFFGFH